MNTTPNLDSSPHSQVDSDTGSGSSLRQVVGSATAGTFVEYYDFAIYGAMAPIIAKTFFPNVAPAIALLSTFAVFALAFVARPLGGLVWGPVGDRIGRRRTLSLIIVTISVATVLIGLTPDYRTIGIAAPILLVVLRLAQGLSAGGEIAGAAIFIAEHAPNKRRGFLVSWLQVATTGALLSGVFVSAAVSSLLSEQEMNSWGWRIPFLLAGPIGVVGLYIRLKVDETPSFEEVKRKGREARNPLVTAMRGAGNLKEMGFAAAYYMPVLVSFYLLLTFMPTYLKSEMKFDTATSLSIIAVAGVIQLISVPIFGKLSDLIGRRMLLRFTTGAFILLTYPAFVLLNSGELALAIGGLTLLAIPTAAAQANNLTPALERFHTNVRFTASAATLGLLAALFGGTAPYVSTYLTTATGSPLAPGFYLMITILPSLIASFYVSETAKKPLLD
ncbi:MFS transporter [Saccharopolyspora spinosa]|uniref:Putative proline/betaine transporter n=1 Tax=Saccharopolyspora spinosa TaxID=60894 RepID=A0A2N3Y3I1_SACSN|nr:MFS transporter [Saccharopolyspora spinosa]PKW17462.1 MHS family proline/betaine transporter-like MFS transporter [Saccharopolyspora spinosa]